MKTRTMKVIDLKPHPKNEEIYGYDENISDLVEKIRRSGSVHTMTVNSKGYILAGHRRRRACMELGIKEVNVEVLDFDTPEEEIEYIIDNNATREKTTEQKSREAKALKEVEDVLAERRRSLNGGDRKSENYRKSEVANPPHAIEQLEQGKSRDIVAKKIGMKSGREVERAISAVDAIDKLSDDGRTEEADLIRGVLNNRSISSAEELARNIDIVEIPEDVKDLVKTGKKSPLSYIEKAKEKNKPKVETKICSVCGKELPIEMFYKSKGYCKECQAEKDRDRKSGIFRDGIGNVIEYDKSLINSPAMLEAINDVKYGGNSKKGTNYDMEVEFFRVTLDNYLMQNHRFMEGNLLNEMPSENKEELKKEVERLSQYVQFLETFLD